MAVPIIGNGREINGYDRMRLDKLARLLKTAWVCYKGGRSLDAAAREVGDGPLGDIWYKLAVIMDGIGEGRIKAINVEEKEE